MNMNVLISQILIHVLMISSAIASEGYDDEELLDLMREEARAFCEDTPVEVKWEFAKCLFEGYPEQVKEILTKCTILPGRNEPEPKLLLSASGYCPEEIKLFFQPQYKEQLQCLESNAPVIINALEQHTAASKEWKQQLLDQCHSQFSGPPVSERVVQDSKESPFHSYEDLE